MNLGVTTALVRTRPPHNLGDTARSTLPPLPAVLPTEGSMEAGREAERSGFPGSVAGDVWDHSSVGRSDQASCHRDSSLSVGAFPAPRPRVKFSP